MQDHLHELSTALARLGHDVEVVTSCGADGRAEAFEEGVRWHFLPAPAMFFDPTWQRLLLERFERLHGERPFDVVHSQSSAALGLVRAGVHRRVPVVVAFHGNFLSIVKASSAHVRRSRRMYTLLKESHALLKLCGVHFRQGNWRLFRDCEAIVPSERQVADTRRSHLLRSGHVHVVPNGVNAELFRPQPRADVRRALGLDDRPLLVSVGRLDSDKGTHLALRALPRIDAPRVGLVAVGDGSDRERLVALARELWLDDRLVLPGRQPAGRVAAYLAAADVFVFPTLLAEAAPLVLLQAMACGVPVVASDIGAIPEMLGRDGAAGLLVPPGDLDALVAAVGALLHDPERRRRMGEAGRRRVLESYTVERMAERTAAVYALAAERFQASPRSEAAAVRAPRNA